MTSTWSYLKDPNNRKKVIKLLKVSAAHHPHCDYYNKHVFMIRGVKICRGCAVFYPSATFSQLFIWFLPVSWFTVDPKILILLGLTLSFPALFHVTKIDKLLKIDRFISSLSRLFLGIGTGCLLRFIFIVDWVYKIIGVCVAISIAIIVVIKRMKTFWAICSEVNCKYRTEREYLNHCPGLLPLNELTDPILVHYFNTTTPDERILLINELQIIKD
ncbi:MAG: hypothetical protein OEY49_13040 [Candidatus Heimdallarchaeota archaeon]|nr:hypothetical protein [Candidatus Heimdallarchaeota archaeon]